MDESATPDVYLHQIIQVLVNAGIPYIATGALVRNVLAPTRTSEDFDLVLRLEGRTIEEIRTLFVSHGFVVAGPLKGNFGTRLVLDLPQFEADLWIAPGGERDAGEFSRARTVEYHGRPLRIMDPEDYVLRKLVNYRQARRGNTKDLDDAYQVLLHAWSDIDTARLIARATGYRADDTARELVELAREDHAALEAGREPEE